MQQMKKMGGMGAMMKMLPGLGNVAAQMEGAGLDDSFIKRQEAIVFSMTPQEREKPELLNAKRVALYAVRARLSDINKLTLTPAAMPLSKPSTRLTVKSSQKCNVRPRKTSSAPWSAPKRARKSGPR